MEGIHVVLIRPTPANFSFYQKPSTDIKGEQIYSITMEQDLRSRDKLAAKLCQLVSRYQTPQGHEVYNILSRTGK